MRLKYEIDHTHVYGWVRVVKDVSSSRAQGVSNRKAHETLVFTSTKRTTVHTNQDIHQRLILLAKSTLKMHKEFDATVATFKLCQNKELHKIYVP